MEKVNTYCSHYNQVFPLIVITDHARLILFSSINLILCRLLTTLCRGAELELVASFSQRGVKGDVRFLQLETGKVGVKVDLEVAEESGGDYSWGIYEFPIDYTEVHFTSLIVKLMRFFYEKI